MPKIVSVSRRTDVPAFYGEWFRGRLEAGFAGWRNPFGGQRQIVSLARGDVAAFVFWFVAMYGKVRRALAGFERGHDAGLASHTLRGNRQSRLLCSPERGPGGIPRTRCASTS